MNTAFEMTNNKLKINWPLFISAVLLLVSFFIPWLKWPGSTVSGYDFPSQQFFKISEEKFDLANPFPQYSFLNYAFWIIPAGAILVVILTLNRKKTNLLSVLTSIAALSLVTIYILFTQTIIEQVGTVKSLLLSLKLGIYATIIAAAGITFTSTNKKIIWKVFLILIGPILMWAGFNILSKQALKDHSSTEVVKADYKLTSGQLLKEFNENDSLANAKYKEKILVVTGNISEAEQLNDSTVNIKFVDSSGSYALFSLQNEEAIKVKDFKEGDPISLKGSCSGGEFSDILEVTFITFKRSVISK